MRKLASIRYRWPLWMLLACAVPLAFLALRTRTLMQTGFGAAELQLEATVVQQVGTALELRLAQSERVASRAARILADRQIPEATRVSLLLDELASEPLIAHVGIYGRDHKRIDEVRAVGPMSEGSSPLELPSVESEANTWLPVAFAANGKPIVRCLVPIVVAGGITGFVLATLQSDKLDEVVEMSTRGLPASSQSPLLVIARGGERIAGKADPARARAFLEQNGPPKGVEALISWSAVDFQGQSVNASLSSMESRDWRVLIIRAEQDAYPGMFRARNELLFATIAVLVLAGLVAVWLARRTAEPILQLARLTQAYGQRKFQERANVRTGDELEMLGDSLGEMAGSLAASESEIARRIRVESNLSRYLPEHIAKSIAEGDTVLDLGGERKVVSVLFADVVAFTKFSDSAQPEQVVLFLNELFGLLSEIVFKHGGTVDKFMGDCLMAIFGAPVGELHEARALACAEDMHRFVETMRPAWTAKFSFEVRLGIGVASGAAVVGNLGSEKRMEYTAIGDIVNVAARLESMARPGQTLLTSAVAKGAGEKFEYATLGAQMLRGKSEKVEVFELVSE